MHELQCIVLRRAQMYEPSDISNFWAYKSTPPAWVVFLRLFFDRIWLKENLQEGKSTQACTRKHTHTLIQSCTELAITEQSADLCRVGAEMVRRQCCWEPCVRNPQKPSCIVRQQRGWGEKRVSLCVDPAGRDTEIFSNQEKLNLLTGSLCRAC